MSSRRNFGTSSQTIVGGSHRYKYFKRPIMPRVSAVPPQVLLAPTKTENPMEPVDNFVEPTVKDQEVQTAYRESEAQTLPYTPDYIVNQGEDPDILLLKNFTYENGLPLGKNEIEMIEYARLKREMETNLPPFTDEASLILRKRLMEHQEIRELKMREAEMDSVRNQKLELLERALVEREESKEFMTSQRLESVRLLRMEEREKVLQKIRHKRIKALRRLARERNQSDPVLSEGKKRDIINDYFEKGSTVYAPLLRDGDELAIPAAQNDVASRTMPLDSIGNIMSLEYTIPRRLTEDSAQRAPLMAKTMPAKAKPTFSGGGRAAEERLTSAAQRTVRMTKRDVEEMHQILLRKKLDAMGMPRPKSGNQNYDTDTASITLADVMGAAPATRNGGGGDGVPNTAGSAPSRGRGTILSQLMAKKPKGRPPTPDLTQDRILRPPEPKNEDELELEQKEKEDAIAAAGASAAAAAQAAGADVATASAAAAAASAAKTAELEGNEVEQEDINYELHNNNAFQAAVTLLQRLIRGRAVQNIMFEGKFRRRELIEELKAADAAAQAEAASSKTDAKAFEQQRAAAQKREQELNQSTVDVVAGSISSNLFASLAQEKDRIDTISEMQAMAKEAIAERFKREAEEAGRRQREGKAYPHS